MERSIRASISGTSKDIEPVAGFTHRLATIRKADVIFVLKDGMVVERGTHEKLLARGGLYRELYDTQFKKEESIVVASGES